MKDVQTFEVAPAMLEELQEDAATGVIIQFKDGGFGFTYTSAHNGHAVYGDENGASFKTIEDAIRVANDPEAEPQEADWELYDDIP